MLRHVGTIVVTSLVLAGAGAIAWIAIQRSSASNLAVSPEEAKPIAVDVARVRTGPIQEIRVLNGTLESSSRFVVTAKASGLIKSVLVDIGDSIGRNAKVAEIDDAEYAQAEAQASAELAVRKAEEKGAASNLALAEGDHARATALKARGIASDAELDETFAALETAKAALMLAESRVKQAEAALLLAQIRTGYTMVRASWTGGPDTAVVGERFQDAGNTVQIGDPIISVVALHPLRAVVYVTERDYASLREGQSATLTTDAVSGEFEATVARVAPIFREASRQARVELLVENTDQRLRPGMFARVRTVLRSEDQAVIVPLAAITRRDGKDVVFYVNEETGAAEQTPVRLGIVQGEHVQLLEPQREGLVVVLGQQLLRDGSPVRIHTTVPAAAPAEPAS